jgi:cation transport ATPase
MNINNTPHSNASRDDTNGAGRSKELLIPRIMASLLCLIIVVIGAMAVMTAHYYLRNGRLGMEITLEGLPAVAMGASTIFLGLLPLALWFRTKRTRVVWLILCFVAAAVAYGVSVFLQHI